MALSDLLSFANKSRLSQLLEQVATLSGKVTELYPSYVRITTTGSTFSPQVELAEGSNATVSWEVEGGSTVTGLNPTIDFGTAATRYVRMSVADGELNAIGDVVTFNIGFDHTADAGTYGPGTSYDYTAQSVSVLQFVNNMVGLKRFLAATSTLACALDFTGMSELEYIECYGAAVTSVTLEGCTKLIRLCMEGDDLSTLDLNPVAGNLYDLRASGNQSPLTLALLSQPLSKLYHYCAQSETVVNHPTASQLPVVQELWDWSSGQSGALVVRSSAITSLVSNGNAWTSADLTDCSTLTTINLSNCELDEAAVDAVLAEVESWGTNNGTLYLSGNVPPSETGSAHVTTLQGRGWTVGADSVGGGSSGETLWEDQFDRADVTGIANLGNGWSKPASAAGSGDANISSGDIVLNWTGGYSLVATTAGGELPADYTVETELPVGDKGSYFGIAGRWYDGNGVRVLFENETTCHIGNAQYFGSETIIFTAPSGWTNTAVTHTLGLRFSGTTVEVLCDGQVAATTTSTINATQTGTGIGFCGEGGSRHRTYIKAIANS